MWFGCDKSHVVFKGICVVVLSGSGVSKAWSQPLLFSGPAGQLNITIQESDAAQIAAQYRQDVHYQDPTKCGIKQANAQQRADLAAVGTFENRNWYTNGYAFGSAELIKNTDLDLKGGQVIVTNLHVFKNPQGELPTIGEDGSVNPNLFKVHFPACKSGGYAVTKVCPGSVGNTYEHRQTEDYVFAFIKGPACPEVSKKAIDFREVSEAEVKSLINSRTP